VHHAELCHRLLRNDTAGPRCFGSLQQTAEAITPWYVRAMTESITMHCSVVAPVEFIDSNRFLRVRGLLLQCKTARLFNKSVTTSTIPKQWKVATIASVPKIATPREHADFRPISVTSVLSRALKRVIVRKFIYPALLEPPAQLSYSDQYAFRPTGSTTTAVVALLQSATELLSYNPYVVVIRWGMFTRSSFFRSYCMLLQPGGDSLVLLTNSV